MMENDLSADKGSLDVLYFSSFLEATRYGYKFEP